MNEHLLLLQQPGVARRSVDFAQYPSLGLTEHLALEEIRPSIGSVGDAYDNALMESINGLYKAECIRTLVFHDGPYKTIADVEYASRRLGRLVQPAPERGRHGGSRRI